MIIRTANDLFLVKKVGGYRSFVQFVITRNWGKPLVIDWDNPRGELVAQVWRSSWVVQCPFCPGAIEISPGDPFFCVDCLMQANGFRPMRVIWPENRQDIERVLLQRPDPMTRNWLPLKGETVEVLRIENQQHGHGVP